MSARTLMSASAVLDGKSCTVAPAKNAAAKAMVRSRFRTTNMLGKI
jgi:hypothetical protein